MISGHLCHRHECHGHVVLVRRVFGSFAVRAYHNSKESKPVGGAIAEYFRTSTCVDIIIGGGTNNFVGNRGTEGFRGSDRNHFVAFPCRHDEDCLCVPFGIDPFFLLSSESMWNGNGWWKIKRSWCSIRSLDRRNAEGTKPQLCHFER